MTVNPHPKHRAVKIRRGTPRYKQLQSEVLARDHHTCQQCGIWTCAPPHHIVKISQGGDDVIENMATLCIFCHDKYPNWKEKV